MNNITLRSFLEADQEQILDTVTSNTVNKTYMLPDYENRSDAIPLFLRLKDLSNDPNRYVRCISLDDTAIGYLNDVETHDGEIELGYVIHPAYHNRGFMTAAMKLAITELFELGYRTVICGAFEENKASQRVMEKAGMTKCSHTDTISYRDKEHLCIYYHITAR